MRGWGRKKKKRGYVPERKLEKKNKTYGRKNKR